MSYLEMVQLLRLLAIYCEAFGSGWSEQPNLTQVACDLDSRLGDSRLHPGILMNSSSYALRVVGAIEREGVA